jgi:hypothetical protein
MPREKRRTGLVNLSTLCQTLSWSNPFIMKIMILRIKEWNQVAQKTQSFSNRVGRKIASHESK